MMKKTALCAILASTALVTACQNTTDKPQEIKMSAVNVQPIPSQQSSTNAAQTGVINTSAVNSQVTVSQLATLKDDSQVSLTGKVTKSLGDEKYEFADATGVVVVEIDDEAWQGRAVTANDTLTIDGELDISHLPTKRTKVDVDTVTFH